MAFQDHFSAHAADYAYARPGYPSAMLDWLTDQCQHTDLAWDCATGNGQVAVPLTNRFQRIIASDASRQQLAHAQAHDRIQYCQCLAEQPSLADTSVDLVTVAQALHWFDIDKFFAAVDRVLRGKGILAVWSYDVCHVAPPIDAQISHFYHEVVGPYWPPERELVANRYESIQFPYAQIAVPEFNMQRDWSCEQLCHYLASWSATRRCREAAGKDPIPQLFAELQSHWPQGLKKTVSWPLTVVVCRKN